MGRKIFCLSTTINNNPARVSPADIAYYLLIDGAKLPREKKAARNLRRGASSQTKKEGDLIRGVGTSLSAVIIKGGGRPARKLVIPPVSPAPYTAGQLSRSHGAAPVLVCVCVCLSVRVCMSVSIPFFFVYYYYFVSRWLAGWPAAWLMAARCNARRHARERRN